MKFPWRLYLGATLVGVLAGLVGALFHALLDRAAEARDTLPGLLGGLPVPGWLVLMPLGALVLITTLWIVRRFAPETAGSGVQEVEAILSGARKLRWRRVLPVKFFAGTLAVGSGLVLGREGPTIHIGAALGQMISERLAPRPGDNHALLASGAGAGLATAFNAPLAAIIFVIEELREHFDYRFETVQSVILACCAAVIVSDALLGAGPDMPLPDLEMAPLHALPLFPLLGVLIGALGVLFNHLLLGSIRSFRALGSGGGYVAAGLAGLILGALLWFVPHAVGGGESLVSELLLGQPALLFLVALLAVRLLTTVGSYGIGLPGGIFAPMLALGTICGAAFASLVALVAPALSMAPEVFAVAAMGALFAATVRAPLTGIVLVIELTDARELTLPIVLTCLTATFTAEGMGGRPIYGALLGLGSRPAPRAPVRRIGIAAMILVGFIALEQVDLAWEGAGVDQGESLARATSPAPAPGPAPGAHPRAAAQEPSPVVALSELSAAAGDVGSDRSPPPGDAADERHVSPPATALPAPEARAVVGSGAEPERGVKLAAEPESGLEPEPEPEPEPKSIAESVAEQAAGPARAAPEATKEAAPATRAASEKTSAGAAVGVVATAPRYSIQLISFRERESLARFARDEDLLGKVFGLESDAPVARWHAVLLGAFEDRAAAEAALDNLPVRLKRLSPMIRHLASDERLVPIERP